MIAAVFTFRTPPDGMLDVPPNVAFVNVGFNIGANKANVVFNEVPFNLISGATTVLLTVRLFVVIPVVAAIDEAPTIPVNVGPARFAFRSNAVCVAVDIGLLTSEVLSTFPRPTIALVIPATVPVNVGLANGAYVAKFAKVAKVAKIVANDVPFNVIVGVAIPPLAVNNPDMVAVPVFVKPAVIRPPRGELERLIVPLKIFESEK